MKNILITTCILFISISHMFGQEKLKIQPKDSGKPDIYIDGKKYDHVILDSLDHSKIESVNVIKDEQAVKEYNAPNGVILIETKKGAHPIVIIDKKGSNIDERDIDPVIIIDGKVSDKETLSKLLPDKIESMEVVKGQKAIDQYKAPNGVVIVKTKE